MCVSEQVGMAKIRISKLDAARRQIDCAIRMTFDCEDPVAIHTVIAAGHRIIRDLCEKLGNIESYLRFTDWIEPRYEKQFWGAINASANFLKHSDADPNSIHELNVENSDYMIVFASKWYRDLGNELSFEMQFFGLWWAIQHPRVLKPELVAQFERAGGKEVMEQLIGSARHLSRQDMCKLGKMALGREQRS